jgi:RES domain
MQLQSILTGRLKGRSTTRSAVVARPKLYFLKENADDPTHGLAQLREFTQNRGALFQSDGSKISTSIFNAIGELPTRDGPGTDFHMLYRARVFQSDDKLEAALRGPDVHLGPPPARSAEAGRMNARGVAVFCGANNQKAAIAEVRPPHNVAQ